ncbi:PREDICTED: SLAM family member 8-like [Nanorana parkeri]|uniref:SLAM family member 8-like n=1 Tax=Nanorana parkeri TaxID=125878 RepID=UPI0008547039|nr:PREDICTED: SLAM family member 8-like [Nanorana parkeri]
MSGWLCSAEEVTPITGIRGGSVFLSPSVPLEFNPREVFWRHLSPTDHLVASFSRGSLDTTYQSCFHGRVQLLENLTLEVSGLELKDTGLFTCQMVDTQGHMKLYQFHLTVYEEASKPEVQVFVSRRGEECAIFLSCNVTAGSNVTYSWMVDTGQGDLLNNTYRLYDDRRLLQTTLTSTHQPVSFICVVTNPVSKQNTSVIPWASCLPGQESKLNNGKIVLLVAAFLIILFTTGMICVYFFTRSSGKTPVNRRERITMNTEETILHLHEETEALVNEQTGLQHPEETTSWHNGEMTLGHNAVGGRLCEMEARIP